MAALLLLKAAINVKIYPVIFFILQMTCLCLMALWNCGADLARMTSLAEP
jgi:hypothetical protein